MPEVRPLPDIAVLIADGSLHQRRLLRQLLMQVRVRRILEASDKRTVLRLLVDARPNVLLLDWDLPGGGEMVLRLVRHKPSSPLPDLPVVVTVSTPQHRIVSRIAGVGASEVIAKPVGPNVLWRRLHRAVASRDEAVDWV